MWQYFYKAKTHLQGNHFTSYSTGPSLVWWFKLNLRNFGHSPTNSIFFTGSCGSFQILVALFICERDTVEIFGIECKFSNILQKVMSTVKLFLHN